MRGLGIQFFTPRGTWWQERGGVVREDYPNQLLGCIPPEAIADLISTGTAHDDDEAHSIAKRMKDRAAAIVRQRVPAETGDTGLGADSRAAEAFRELLARRLLVPTEWHPRENSQDPARRTGVAHALLRRLESFDGGNAPDPGRLSRLRGLAAPAWIGLGADGAPRIAIHHSLLDPRETAAADSNTNLRTLAGRYGILETGAEWERARGREGTSSVRVCVLSRAYTARILARARATAPAAARSDDLDSSAGASR